MLRILLNFYLNIGYKKGWFSKILLKKGLKFVTSREDGTIIFNLSFVLLPVKINLVVEEQSHKKDALVAHVIGYVKIIFALLTKVVAFYIKASII